MDEEKLSYEGLENGLENAGFNIEAHVILRILEIARKYDVQNNETIIQFAKRVAGAGSLNMTFVDELEDTLMETKEEDDDAMAVSNKDTPTELCLDFCEICQKTFHSKTEFQAHMLKHPTYQLKKKGKEPSAHETLPWFDEKVILQIIVPNRIEKTLKLFVIRKHFGF